MVVLLFYRAGLGGWFGQRVGMAVLKPLILVDLDGRPQKPYLIWALLLSFLVVLFSRMVS